MNRTYPNLEKAEASIPFRNTFDNVLKHLDTKFGYIVVSRESIGNHPVETLTDDKMHEVLDDYFEIDREAAEKEANEMYQRVLFKGQE